MLLFVVNASLSIVAFLACKLLYEVSAFPPSFLPLAADCNATCFVIARFCRTMAMIWIKKTKPKPNPTKPLRVFIFIFVLFLCHLLMCDSHITVGCWLFSYLPLIHAWPKIRLASIFAGSSSLSLLPGKDDINSKLTELHVQLWCFPADEIS